MLFVSITHLDALQKIPSQVEGIEVRFDLFPNLGFDQVEDLVKKSTHPLMFTLRKKSQGGAFQGSEKERESLIEKLLSFKPAFFDLEYDMCPDFLRRVLEEYKETRFVLSYHNFQETPLDLEEVYELLSKVPAYSYKIAALALSTLDALRMLLFSKKQAKASVICMGEKGEFARVLSPVCGNLLNYSSLSFEEKTAPGQLTAQELIQIYRYPKLNSETKIYGLIGDPVSKSQGHLYHNEAFAKKNLNSVYVKMLLKAEELSSFFSLAKELGIYGLSVTMPLKEKVIPFIKFMDSETRKIGSVNTLLFKEGQILGTNTDGVGALDAIEKKGSVFQKKIIIIGTGGTSRSIAFESKKRGAHVLILGRTTSKAKQLALEVGGEFGGLSEIPLNYDILINTSPDSESVDFQKISPQALIMDVVYVPKDTPLLLKAKSLGCPVVYGEEMFFNQAAAQSVLWVQK